MTPAVERIVEHFQANPRRWHIERMNTLPPVSVLFDLLSKNREAADWWEVAREAYPYSVCVLCLYLMLYDCDYVMELTPAAATLLVECGDPHAKYLLDAVYALNGDEDAPRRRVE